MKSFALILCAAFSMTYTQAPTTDPLTQHAAEYAAALHDSMLDPASFVLDGVYVSKSYDIRKNSFGKRAVIGTYVDICYTVRSHNTMGGYSAQTYAEDGTKLKTNPALSTFSGERKDFYFNVAFGGPIGDTAKCEEKRFDRNITVAVKALAPALYKKYN